MGQSFLTAPIEGNQGKDYIIVNYVDWLDTGISDAWCGTKTYDGHQGTDYTLRSFSQMDSGVNVLAAADGVVTFIQDGLYDRETEGDVSKRLGNYIAIRHPNKYYTYYGHLKTNSRQVQIGDSVLQGQVIAQVGSSGNSTDPHLHFEVWYDSLYVIDPYTGVCGNMSTLFSDNHLYDTSLHVWDQGMHDSLVGINGLRERIKTIQDPYSFKPTASTPVVYWSQLSGVKKDDVLTIHWLTPAQTEWFQYAVTLDRDYWYYYYFSYINNTDLPIGQWKVELRLNGKTITSEQFSVGNSSSRDAINSASQYCHQLSFKELWLDAAWEMLQITSMNGVVTTVHRKDAIEKPSLVPGMYVVKCVFQDSSNCVLKMLVSE